MIGSPATEPGHEGDERQRRETISEPFYMMETQLTVEQYRALMQAEPSDAGDGSDPKVPAAPGTCTARASGTRGTCFKRPPDQPAEAEPTTTCHPTLS
jgi:formylglycine-generating enzyme required for sulfatase activity